MMAEAVLTIPPEQPRFLVPRVPSATRVMDDNQPTDPLRTRVSLLERLHDPEDARSWSEFFRRYETVVRGIARRRGLQEHEAEEVVLEVFRRVAVTIQNFDAGRRPGAFRAWLYQLTRWRAQDKLQERLRAWRGAEDVADVESELAVGPTQGDGLEKEARHHLLEALFKRLEHSVPAKQLQAFRLMVLDDVPVARVCELFQLTPTFAYVIRHRVMKKLRAEAQRLPLGRG